jgi:hypothetical protein
MEKQGGTPARPASAARDSRLCVRLRTPCRRARAHPHTLAPGLQRRRRRGAGAAAVGAVRLHAVLSRSAGRRRRPLTLARCAAPPPLRPSQAARGVAAGCEAHRHAARRAAAAAAACSLACSRLLLAARAARC